MKRFHIFNPKAGKGISPEFFYKSKAADEEIYVTKGVGDAERIALETCMNRDEVHFIVYGGDGTLSEVANGIIKANAGNRVLFSCIPTGSGNDFVRYFANKEKGIYTIDAVKFDDKYSINSLNSGVDSRVVQSVEQYKKTLKAVSGSGLYILGVVNTIFKKMHETWSIKLTLDDGTTEEFINEDFSLALFANGQYYGGGFLAAPLSKLNDGLIDVILVKKVSRAKFISLVTGYKKGIHIDPKTEKVVDKFKDILIYRRCTAIHIEGITNICADGEIVKTSSSDISIAKGVLRYAHLTD